MCQCFGAMRAGTCCLLVLGVGLVSGRWSPSLRPSFTFAAPEGMGRDMGRALELGRTGARLGVRHSSAVGAWRDGNAIDVADKRLSRPIFSLRFPPPVELLLSVPGAFMGFPHAFLGSTPLALGWIACGGNPALGTATLLTWVAGIVAFYGAFAGWFDATKATIATLLGLFPVTCWVLTRAAIPPAGLETALLSLSCSALTVALCIPLKALADRPRPAVSLNLIQHVRKRRVALLVPYIENMCSKGQARDALPSSDVGVMAANAALLWRLSPSLQPLAVAFVTLALFGRMYFWAHHLLDAVSGMSIGLFVLACLRKLDWGARWPHAISSYLIFLVAVAAMKKRMKRVEQDGASSDAV